jgi:hypothetical protein
MPGHVTDNEMCRNCEFLRSERRMVVGVVVDEWITGYYCGSTGENVMFDIKFLPSYTSCPKIKEE